MDNEEELEKARARLLTAEATFENALRARGFELAQVDNVPLTPELKRLDDERKYLAQELERLNAAQEEKEAVNDLERIEDQLNRAFAGQAWHGPSVSEVLEGVSAAQAASRPIQGAHSIWELALHINAWEKAVLARLAGERADLSPDEDWPAVGEESESAWIATKTKLKDGNRRLREAVRMVALAQLDEPIVEGLSSVYVTLQGVVQHDIYHAGQIAIIKKALLEETR